MGLYIVNEMVDQFNQPYKPAWFESIEVALLYIWKFRLMAAKNLQVLLPN